MTATKTTTAALPVAAILAAVVAAGCDPGAPPDGTGETRGPAPQAPARTAGDRAEPEGSPRRASQPAAARPEDLVEQGRQAYLSACIACHNADPAKGGALGPPVAGSSLELLEARVLRGEYPDGYTPKRDTAVMVAMPFLEQQIPAIAAYLEAAGR